MRGDTTPRHTYPVGRRIASRENNGSVHHTFADTLGSTRAATDSTGNVCFSADYYPGACPERSRGRQENDYVTTCAPAYRFAGYELDEGGGSSLYYAYARYYSPSLSRFMSPDPKDGRVANPQTLDRYAYTLNSPETLNDPTGKYPLYPDETPCEIGSGWGCDPAEGLGGGGTGSATFGYDIFDAILGAPGTYLSIDMYGQETWGFSLNLYSETRNWIDTVKDNPPAWPFSTPSGQQVSSPLDLLGVDFYYGFNVLTTDQGTGGRISGFIPELAAVQSQLAQYYRPGFQDMLLAGMLASQGVSIDLNAVWADVTAKDPLAAKYWPYYWQALQQATSIFLEYLPGILAGAQQ